MNTHTHIYIYMYTHARFGLSLQSDIGLLLPVLGLSQGLCGWSRASLEASVGSPGPLSGPGPYWVRSWVLCWRSWAALGGYVRGLGPHVGGLGLLLGFMFAALASWAAKNSRI